MSAAIVALLTVLGQIAGSVGNMQIGAIIATLTQIVPVVSKEVTDVAPLIQNIIDALKSNAEITPEQWALLEQTEAMLDKDFDEASAAAEAEDAAAASPPADTTPPGDGNPAG